MVIPMDVLIVGVLMVGVLMIIPIVITMVSDGGYYDDYSNGCSNGFAGRYYDSYCR